MATLSEIERLAKEYFEARELLKDRVTILEHNIAEAKRKMLPGIRKAVEAAAAKHEALKEAIQEAPDFFVKPKTFILHGIRLGYQKARGEIFWDDESQVIRLIKKHFPEDWEAYVKV